MSRFDLFHTEKNKALSYCRRVMLWPEQWKAFTYAKQLNWKAIKANSQSAKTLPESTGVYVFIIQPGIASLECAGIVSYVGETEGQTLRKRCSSYFHQSEYDVRPHIGEMMHLWKEHLQLFYVETDAADAVALENKLLSAFLPPFNRKFPGTFNKLAKSIYST
ncbi:MAG: hypothetical protein H7A55_19460 [Verrucomicrobiaceae bacterium]|nr:hypothetical protein [Verrucomicrobiaceae bacterium]